MSPVNPDLAQLIGENIKSVRRRVGMTQEELSFRAGLHRTEVSQLEQGLRMPRADTVIKVAGGLNVEIGELFANVAWRPAEYASGGFKVRPRAPEAAEANEGAG
jgi:transcriptional regulator with XRE-family HTH domain